MMDKVRCLKCMEIIEYERTDTYIDYRGIDYDTRLVKCPSCGESIIIEYIELPNREKWLYES